MKVINVIFQYANISNVYDEVGDKETRKNKKKMYDFKTNEIQRTNTLLFAKMRQIMNREDLTNNCFRKLSIPLQRSKTLQHEKLEQENKSLFKRITNTKTNSLHEEDTRGAIKKQKTTKYDK